MANYPAFRDAFRRVTGADEVHAQLLSDMFGTVLALMTELGVKPSGAFGSIFGRMFGNELVSRTCGYWRKISLQTISARVGNLAGSPNFTTPVTWHVNRFTGVNTANGQDIPFIFPIYQGNQGVSYITERQTGGNRPGSDKAPWNVYAFNVGKLQGLLAAGALNGQGVSGSTNQIDIGVVIWGLPSKAPEDQTV